MNIQTIVMPYAISLFRNYSPAHYTDSIAHTYLFQSGVDIFLNITAQEETADSPMLFSSVLHADKLILYFVILKNAPSAFQLALMFGLSIAELELDFQQLFAILWNNLSHMAKMMLVYHLLQMIT